MVRLSLQIRRPVIDEAPVLARLHEDCWRQTYTHLLPLDFFSTDRIPLRTAAWERLITDQLNQPSLIAEVASQPVGFAVVNAVPVPGSPRPVQLSSLYVLQAQHGRGVGQALLDEAIGDAPAFLWVAEENPRARAFYSRNGFHADGEHFTDRVGIRELRLVRGAPTD